MQNVTPMAIAMFGLELTPAIAFGIGAERIARKVHEWPAAVRILIPVALALPYVGVAASQHMFRWQWFALYATVPIGVAWLLGQAATVDPEQHGNWRDLLILLTLGLAVDLRWFESAWPDGLRALNELLLVDVGLYGFLAIRQLDSVGFDFHLKWSDWKSGARELLFFTPLVILVGLAFGFIHPHANWPALWKAGLTWIGIFFLTAAPEELFFRGWLQNFLERRCGRLAALVIASILFGLSHFNKRNPLGSHFNWRYVILATFAGIFYGRAWREHRRIPASTITHTFVDWIWSWWF
jgi:uncharacterized protein